MLSAHSITQHQPTETTEILPEPRKRCHKPLLVAILLRVCCICCTPVKSAVKNNPGEHSTCKAAVGRVARKPLSRGPTRHQPHSEPPQVLGWGCSHAVLQLQNGALVFRHLHSHSTLLSEGTKTTRNTAARLLL